MFYVEHLHSLLLYTYNMNWFLSASYLLFLQEQNSISNQ